MERRLGTIAVQPFALARQLVRLGCRTLGVRLAARAFRTLLCLCALCLCAVAQTHPAHAAEQPPDFDLVLKPAPKISVLTFGPGDAAFLRFGHNAIRVQDPETKTDWVYNFGTFRFDDPFLIVDFLTGKFQYWLSVSTFRQTLEYYQRANRDVVEQELNVGHIAAHKLNLALRENAKPENKHYLYDYYRDNCSTRVRDAIDVALGGAFQERSEGYSKMTLRDHTLRAVADDLWLYVGLDIAMGSYIDQPETRWGEMFLPSKLHDGLDRVVFSGVHGTAALVKNRTVHARAHARSKMRRKPPDRTMAFLQTGIAFGATFAFLGWEAYRRRKVWAQAVLALGLGLYGAVVGTLGLLFIGLWLLTNHQVAYHNENILQCAPWALLLPVSAWGVFRLRPKWIRLAYRTTLAGVACAVLGLLLEVLPFMQQQNERIIALLLPIWCGALTALYLMQQRTMVPLLVPARASEEPAAPSPEETEEARPSKKPPPQDDEEDDEVPVGPESQPAPAE